MDKCQHGISFEEPCLACEAEYNALDSDGDWIEDEMMEDDISDDFDFDDEEETEADRLVDEQSGITDDDEFDDDHVI